MTNLLNFYDARVQKSFDMIAVYIEKFNRLRDMNLCLVEFGVDWGGSLILWAEMFPNWKIYGIDLPYIEQFRGDEKKAICEDLASRYPNRFILNHGSQSDREFLERIFGSGFKEKIGIVIDDGSHIASDISQTFEIMYPKLMNGGVYCIEDWTTSHDAPAIAAWAYSLIEGIAGRGERKDVTNQIYKMEILYQQIFIRKGTRARI